MYVVIPPKVKEFNVKIVVNATKLKKKCNFTYTKAFNKSYMQLEFKHYILEDSTYKGGGKKIVMPKGSTVHKLSSNENPLGYSPKVKEALKNSLDDLSMYPDNTDIRLRQALVADFDGVLKADNFITANSGSEIIDMISKAFLNENDEIIVSQPCFLPYTAFTRWMGATAINVPMTSDYNYNLYGILNAIGPKTKLIFLASPNNPSGNYISFRELLEFIDHLPDHVLLVLDEVYRHFAEVEDYTSALPFVLEGKNVIAVNSFSKTYGLAGLRVGYCYAPLEISNYIRKICKPFLLSTLASRVPKEMRTLPEAPKLPTRRTMIPCCSKKFTNSASGTGGSIITKFPCVGQ